MIGPSRRRRSIPVQTDPFGLHTRISRRRTRSRRMLGGSVAALVASLVAWLAGAPLIVHGAVTLAALLLALVLPLRSATAWALGWIAERVGFSYQTALELADADDPYGLHAAVAERANRRVRNLDPPRATAWWLPVLALALGLLILPAASLTGFGGGGPGSGAPPPPAQGGLQEVPEPDLPTPETVDPLADPDEPQRADEPGSDEGANDSDEELSGESESENDSEQQVLDRFLDNLREREPEEEEEQEAEGGAAPQNLQPSPQEGEQQGDGEQQEGGAPPDTSEEREGEAEGQSQGDPEDGERQQDEQGSTPDEGGEGEQQPQGVPGEEGDDQAEGGFEEGNQPGGEGEPEAGDTPDQGDDDQGFGAGEQGSEERPSGAIDGAPDTDPDFLEGQLGGGPENAGGLIRLPGREEFDLPGTIDPQAYVRAAEEAVTEGDLPVDYQEVIRNYFQ